MARNEKVLEQNGDMHARISALEAEAERACGMNAYASKPIDPDALKKTITNVLK